MQLPINGDPVYKVNNIVIWTHQGKTFVVGGSFPVVAGTPSRRLGFSTNTTQGYGNGQMLATATGLLANGSPSTLTPGVIYNLDPASTDTGQAQWNGMIIADPSLHKFLNVGTTYQGTLQVAAPEKDWEIRQQFLYASGTKDTDQAIVKTALQAYENFTSTALNKKGTIVYNQIQNSSNGYETIFSY